MKLRVTFVFCSVLMACLTSCKSSDPVGACHLISFNDDYRRENVSYDYNASGQIEIEHSTIRNSDGSSDNYQRTFVFGSGGFIISKTGIGNYQESWQYQDGKVSTITITRGHFSDTTSTYLYQTKYYTYTGDKLTAYKIVFRDNSVQYGNFSYDGDNVKTDSVTYDNGSGQLFYSKSTYTRYDDKKNPRRTVLKAFGNIDFVPSDITPDAFDLSANNVIEATEDQFNVSFTYDYNAQGIPKVAVRQYATGGTFVSNFAFAGCSGN